MKNGISIDLEEYFHAANLGNFLHEKKLETRLQASLELTLSSLNDSNISATFFILGELVKKHSSLLREVHELGHEIASHSYSHRKIYDLSPQEFYEEVKKSKEELEDLTGASVKGYRAPNFSITDATPWAYEKLIEAGYKYDSSIYPVYHPRYSNPKQKRFPHLSKTPSGNLLSVPLATYKVPFLTLNLPVAGGAYWRLLPKTLIIPALKAINKKEEKAFFTYFHPWELDPQQPVLIENFSLTKFRHYGNIKKFGKILKTYFKHFDFDTYYNILNKDYSEHFRS